MRWIIVSSKTGEPVGPKTSFPTKRLASAHCGPGEEPREARLVRPTGPFSDELEYGLGYMQGRGAS